MSKRLQVLLDEQELRDLQRVARMNKTTVAEYVRQTLREARRRLPSTDAARKLAAVRAASHHNYPTADIADMLAEIESGYAGRKEP